MRGGFLFLAGAIALAAITGRADAQESAIVPGWTPPIGQKHSWRIEHTRQEGRSGYPQRWGELRGAVTQHMTTLGRTPNGYSLLWEFDPPDESVEGNRFLRAIMSLYRLDRISIGVDWGGKPLIAYGAQARDEISQSQIAQLPAEFAGEARLLENMRASAAEDPTYEIQLFARASMLIGRLQRAEPWTARQGESFRLQQTDYMFNSRVTGEAAFTVDEIDKANRSVRISWIWDIPVEKLPVAMRRHIDEKLATTAGQAAALPLPLRGDAGSARFVFSGQARLSIEDGALMSAQEERAHRVGFDHQYLSLRIEREP